MNYVKDAESNFHLTNYNNFPTLSFFFSFFLSIWL